MHQHNFHKETDYEPEPCAKCSSKADKSQHHCFPQRWQFTFSKRNWCIWLCRPCHDILEKIIECHEYDYGPDKSQKNKLPDEYYVFICLAFITSQDHERLETAHLPYIDANSIDMGRL